MTRDADRETGPSLASDVRQQFARAMLPEGRDFAGPVDGSITVETVERRGRTCVVAVDGAGNRMVSSVGVDLEASR